MQNDPLGLISHRTSTALLADFPVFIEHVLHVKSAAAIVHKKNREITSRDSTKILKACRELMKADPFHWAAADPYAGGGGIVLHTLINEQIQKRSGVELAVINRGQSTADVLATAHRMALYELCDLLMAELLITQKTFGFLARKFAKTSSIARTCLRDALPVPLGKLFEGSAEFYDRCKERISRAQFHLLRVNLGGTVFGSGEGTSSVYQKLVLGELAALSKLKIRRRRSFYDASQNIDDLGELGKFLQLTAEGTIKIAQDLRLLMSGPEFGFNEIEFPKIIQGSSFFKDKNNPTILETTIQGCFLVISRCKVVELAQTQGELHLNTFEGAAGFALQEALLTLARALRCWNDYGLGEITSKKG